MDLFFHMALPALLLLVLGVRARYALGLAPLAVLPDLDGFFGAGHRVYFHNLFVVAFVVLAAYLTARAARSREPRLVTAVSGFFVASHLILDLADPIGLLFPLTRLGLFARLGILLHLEPRGYLAAWEAGALPPSGWSYPDVARPGDLGIGYYMVTPEAFQFLLLAALGLLLFAREARARWLPPRPTRQRTPALENPKRL